MTQLERADLHAAIEVRYPDNTTEEITPLLLREGLHELVDSVFVTATDTGAVPNVPLYQAGTTYVVGFVVRYTPLNGLEGFYAAKNPGKLTAPGPGNTTDWKVVPGPTTATALSQSVTLVQAQGLDQTSVVAGREYLIDFGADASGYPQTITLRGLANDFFDVQGTLEVNGVRTAVTDVDVQAGTWKVAGVDAYTKTQTDVLLATKQGAIVQQVYQSWPFNSTTLTLTSSSFNQYLRLDAQANSTLNLPTPSPSDVGKVIALWHYGRSANLVVAVQAKYTNGVKPLDSSFTAVLPVLAYNYVAELQVLLIDRGTPYNDTVPGYALTSLSPLDSSVLATKNYVNDALNALPAGYTDVQARAAQLNRTAPGGTTTVTFTAESPTDYGTAASGNFVLDGTGAVVGKEAYFNVDVGGGAAGYVNPPSGQPFDFTLAPYVPGKLNRYAARVFPDRIEVIAVAN